MKNPTHSFSFETLAETLRAFIDFVKTSGGVFEEDEDEMFLFTSPVNYQTTMVGHYPLASFKGRGTKKYAHMTIYRMESGRYELVNYIL